jgi:streptogramin lyase
VLAIVLLGGGDGKPPARATTTTPPPPARRASIVGAPITVGGLRPNALTVAGGRIWALSASSGELDTVDPQTNKLTRRKIGGDGKSLAGGFGSVWVLKGKTRTLLRRNARTGRRIGRVVEISYAGQPVQVVAGLRALWVGVRTPNADGAPETVVKIDPSNFAQTPITIPGGVQDLAVGAGALWVSNRFAKSVVRVDARNGVQRTIRLHGTPGGLAVGSGAVWVATRGDDTITRISPRGTSVQEIPMPNIPTRVAVGGGSVWATSSEGARLLRIDPDTRKLVERLDTGIRPFALDVEHGSAVWLTLLGDNAVQRVSFSK